jgi:PmbA protein
MIATFAFGHRPMSPPAASAVHQSRFSHGFDTLQQLARDVLAHAEKGGASACEVDVSEGFGQSVSVRRGEVETIEYNRDKGVSVTVYLGQRGQASTSDFSSTACATRSSAAVESIARFTAADPCAGLPEEKPAGQAKA